MWTSVSIQKSQFIAVKPVWNYENKSKKQSQGNKQFRSNCIFSVEVHIEMKGERDDSFGMIKGDLQGDRRVLFTIN